MEIKFNEKNEEVELCFTWKEIWTMIKEKKLTMNIVTLDKVTGFLVNMRHEILQRKTKKE